MLFSFGDFDLTKYMVAGSYDSQPNSRLDLDSYTDGYGITRRTALKHTKTIITFKTVEMDAETMKHIMSNIVSRYSSYEERDNENCSYYDTENFVVKANSHFYLDPNFKQNVKYVDETTLEPSYFGETTFKFTEY